MLSVMIFEVMINVLRLFLWIWQAQAIMLLAGESSLTAAVMAEVAARHRRQSLIQLAGKFRTSYDISVLINCTR